jgi:DNA-binding NarL/FixJ family response regulator
MTTPIRLLLVDDYAILRSALANLLNATRSFRVVGDTDDIQKAFELFRLHQPDVILLDVMMSRVRGMECLRMMIAAFPTARVLVFSCIDSDEHLVQALDLGAYGWVAKNGSMTELVSAIKKVHRGKKVINAEIERRVEQRANLVRLSVREFEVLHLMRKGMSNPEIGHSLSISTRTAKAHVAAIIEKLQVTDRTEAVVRGFESGLLRIWQ